MQVKGEFTDIGKTPRLNKATKLGMIAGSILKKMDDICRSNPPPAKPFKFKGRFYPGKPQRGTMGWVSEITTLLRNEGILKDNCDSKPAVQPSDSSRLSNERPQC